MWSYWPKKRTPLVIDVRSERRTLFHNDRAYETCGISTRRLSFIYIRALYYMYNEKHSTTSSQPTYLDSSFVSLVLPQCKAEDLFLILLFENHCPFLPLVVHPNPEHPSTVEVKHDLPFSIHDLDSDNPAFTLPCLSPSVASRCL